ncbi:MAG: SBBP repeat-containing protein [Candidatus Krumholzibacteria bacterium]|nr:SBBP repeat-containing protein [Candidatus Krumholzibacteria bacterium]MDH5270855.1 SBBP repeat-containing protein [Candidatus Krumholzibacteria bacterium]
MKHTWWFHPVIVLLVLTTGGPASGMAPAHLWSRNFGSATDDFGHSVAMDASGNVILAGQFTGTVNFGGSNLVSAGARDIFLAKFDASGTHLWSQRLGGTQDDYGLGVCVDATGYVCLTGYFHGTASLGGSNLVSAGSADIFVARYSPSGAHAWSRRFGSTGSDFGHAIDTDSFGNMIMTGNFSGSVDFGSAILASAGGTDMVCLALTAGGGNLWSRRGGGTGTDYANRIAVDGSGNAYVTGYFSGTAEFGGSYLTSAGFDDAYLVKYNASGTHQWSLRFGGPSYDYGQGIAVDAAGNAVVTGLFYDTANFGGSNLVSAGSADIYLVKFDSGGAHLWSQRFGGGSYDSGNGVAIDSRGNVLATGSFQSTASFGGGNLTSRGSYDVFVVKTNAGGAYQWVLQAGGTFVETGRSVAVDAAGNLAVTGYFDGTTNFGGEDLTSNGASDVFVARYAAYPAAPVIRSIADIGNDQGRRVRIDFNRSAFDAALSSIPVVEYEIYRRSDALQTASAADPVGVPSRRILDDGWVYAGSVAAHGTDRYLIDAPTDADSTVAFGQHYSTFFVRAATTDEYIFYDSPPDSGYSIDNLAPGVPGGLVSNIGLVSWNKCADADFDYFTVYGSPTQNFGDAVLYDYTTGTSMNLNGSGYSWAFVTATDFSGNESSPGWVKVATGVGDIPRSYVLSVSNFPNPFNPSTTVSYTVPSRGNVTVAIYDARGARVATLVDNATRDAGAYRADWNGRSDSGTTLSSGVYFARIEQAGTVRTRKIVLLK